MLMVRFVYLIAVWAVFFHSAPVAQAQVLTLDGAIEATLAQYPTLAAQRSALEAIRANAQVLRDNRMPNVRLHNQLTLGTANGMSGSYFSLGLIVPTSGARRADNRMDLATGNIALVSADWEVLNFGRFRAEDNLFRADVAAGEAGLVTEQFRLRQVVTATYLDALRLDQFMTLEALNVARIDTARRIITNLVRNGIKPGLDSSLASVAFSRARLAYLRVREQYQEAAAQLATLTGRTEGSLRIDTTLRLDVLPAPTLAPPLPHPLLFFQERQIAREEAEIVLIRKTALPRVSLLGAAWGRGSSLTVENNFGPLGSGLGYSRTNFLLGVATTVNLMDFRRVASRTRLQRYRVQEATDQLAVERVQLQNALNAADSVLAVLRIELTELPVALRSARAAYSQRLALYNNGLENILGLTEALRVLAAVEKEYAETRNRAVRVRLQRAYATNDYTDFFALFRR